MLVATGTKVRKGWMVGALVLGALAFWAGRHTAGLWTAGATTTGLGESEDRLAPNETSVPAGNGEPLCRDRCWYSRRS